MIVEKGEARHHGMAMNRPEAPQSVSNAGRPTSDGAGFDQSNSAAGRAAGRTAAATIADVNAAVAAAAGAFPDWSATGPGERRHRLLAAAQCLERREADFTACMAEETGATASWASFNVSLAVAMLRDAASMTTQIRGEIIPSDRPGVTAFAVRQPVGVVAGIAPWNAPVILGVRAIATPLACGNTVVLKASELCPRTHRMIGEVMGEAGLGDGVVSILSNAPADADWVMETLIAHPAVRRINFTGSTRVGRLVAETAARHLKPVVLELGGKAPLIILDDADLDEAVRAAAYGAFMNQGQICMATERIVVDARVADAFAEKFSRKAATLIAGDARAGDTPLGTVIGREAIERLSGLVQDAVLKGARMIAGGRINGTMMDATVLDHVTPAMRLYSEESFGPVVAMVRVNGVEEAIRVANDTEYGLSAAVFGRDVTRALAVARRIEAGTCHINAATVQDEAQMPIGGIKASGYGRLGGMAAVHEFTDLRWITIATEPGDYPI